MNERVAGNGLLARATDFLCEDLREVERVFFDELRCWHPYITDILAQMTGFRGKRLRPILLLLCAKATGDINANHKVLAAVVEMIHMATLVHDDVLDEAETRRHVATVNARWNNETSVLFGDYLFTHAFHLASSLESTLACRLIGRATNVVCVGELSQIHERGNFDLNEEIYLRMIEGKTAELCAVCCRLGAEFSGAKSETVDSLEQYGRGVGIAFQIVDDLLDVVGNENDIGKSLGTDLQKQKLTLPLIRLLSQSCDDDAIQIRELLSQPNPDTWSELQRFLDRSDALQYSQSRADEFADAARRHLQCVADSPTRQILEQVAQFATHRFS